MKTEEPRVAILIVNWNKKDQVTDLLQSVKKINYDNREIVVVDNASTDGSVEEIQKLFPEVTLIVNRDNMGGTGGFNTGLKYVLKHKDGFEYVWLLDNDAEINEHTLKNLLDVVEDNEQIGIAGSRIVDINDRETTLELGAFVKNHTIGVVPNKRNKKNPELTDPEEVDYVAICSALVRVEALDKTGCMDERMFIFWDDIEWGLDFRDNNYKVVAVPDSVAYHGSFTERDRGALTDYYYWVRNPLLVYSKHVKGSRRLLIFFNYLRNLFKLFYFGLFTGKTSDCRLVIYAVSDFCFNKWGRYDKTYLKNESTGFTGSGSLPDDISNEILVIAGDTKSNILGIKEELIARYPDAELTLLVESDRTDIFEDSFDKLIQIDKEKLGSIGYVIAKFYNIWSRKFDFSVNVAGSTNIYLQPFSFALKRAYQYHRGNSNFSEVPYNYYHSYIPIIVYILGDITSLFFVPFLYLASFRYNSEANE